MRSTPADSFMTSSQKKSIVTRVPRLEKTPKNDLTRDREKAQRNRQNKNDIEGEFESVLVAFDWNQEFIDRQVIETLRRTIL